MKYYIDKQITGDFDETVEVAAVDPLASMLAVENEALAGIAIAIREKLSNVIDTL